ncbi:MAG: RsfS/YbeB/iojap family protein, partial [Lachnospiraceae bacterium]|nr:RsfS/YbeB/iojap family protein [Lachnospiraceae bacterium]
MAASEKSKAMIRIAIAALEEKKAEDLRALDISEISVLADYFLIAGGSNRNQMQAMCDVLQEK